MSILLPIVPCGKKKYYSHKLLFFGIFSLSFPFLSLFSFFFPMPLLIPLTSMEGGIRPGMFHSVVTEDAKYLQLEQNYNQQAKFIARYNRHLQIIW